MESIDEYWNSFQNMNLDSDHAKKIKTVLEKANFTHLCSEATKIRREKSIDGLTCSVNIAKFTYGTYNLVIALTFSDKIQWIARIMLPQDEDDLVSEDPTNEDVTKSLLSEIASMNYIRSKTTIPIPRVFGHSVTKNAFGHPYILMEALQGTVLENRMALSIPDTHKRKFAAQFAGYIYELGTLQFPKIGSLSYESNELEITPFQISSSWINPLSSSLEYSYLFRKAETKEIHSEHPDVTDWAAAAWFLEKSLTSMVTEEHLYGPFPLCHLDLDYNNILVDEEFNITAVLDWSNTQTVPIERFVVNPEFVAPPAAPEEYKRAVFEFRDIFVQELGRIEGRKDEDRGLSLSGLFGSSLAEVVFRCTCSPARRAVFDAQLTLALTFGRDAKWEDFKKFFNGRLA
ncbi:hypothetical protein N7517_010912 [Penicillium concentricum]|uniref:Aminoglycoside phosphotransferase domain-containing protein n=1 Tax=Penicillium concentricum TaxID=293559 RepID=A0A9W9USW4_9EURO|nr:uncharacterized protein N7517_010912 [Penicillium concentricum]KAJ5356303.1 hypothetical protein N7517_010912 [Penicillium concentricum]